MADLSAKIAQAKKAGYSDGEIASFLGQDSNFAPKIAEARKAGYDDASIISFLSKPEKPARSLMGDVTGAMANVNRGLGIGDELAAGFGTAIDAATGRLPKRENALASVAAGFQGRMKNQRTVEDDFAAERPKAAALASGVGLAATMAVPNVGATKSANILGRVAKGALSAAAPAAAYGLVDRGTLKERLEGANKNALAAGALGGTLGAAFGRETARPRKPVRPEVAELVRRGVQVTPGQASGGMLRTAEDAATSLPLVGPAIQNARRAGVESFNRTVADEALANIGEKVPADIPAGRDLVGYVQSQLSKRYDDITPEAGLAIDAQLGDDLKNLGPIIADMTPESAKRLEKLLNERVVSRLKTGPISGEMYGQLQSELGNTVRRYSASTDADQRAIAEALEGTREALRNAAARQNPTYGAEKAKVDRAWAEFKRLEGAAAAGEGGVFTPKQYAAAVKRGDRSVDRGQYARGNALKQGLSDAAVDVLPSTVPNTGTADRSMLGMLVGAPGAISASAMAGGPGAGLAAAAGTAGTVGALGAASKAYSPKAMAAFNRALSARLTAQERQAAFVELEQLVARDRSVTPLYREALRRLSANAPAAVAAGAGRQPSGVSIEAGGKSYAGGPMRR